MSTHKMTKKQKKVNIGDKAITIRAKRKDAIVDTAQALKLRCNGLSLQEIADTQGVSRQSIHRALEPYKEHIQQLELYRGNRDSIQDMAAAKCLNTLLTKDMESEKASSLAAAFKNFNDASRLERGQSTSNQQIMVVDLTKFSEE